MQSDVGELQRQQRAALAASRSAAQAGAAPARPLRAEETAATRAQSDQVSCADGNNGFHKICSCLRMLLSACCLVLALLCLTAVMLVALRPVTQMGRLEILLTPCQQRVFSRRCAQALLAAQHEGVERQDAQLDRVEAAVGRVQAQAQAVHGEARARCLACRLQDVCLLAGRLRCFHTYWSPACREHIVPANAQLDSSCLLGSLPACINLQGRKQVVFVEPMVPLLWSSVALLNVRSVACRCGARRGCWSRWTRAWPAWARAWQA